MTKHIKTIIAVAINYQLIAIISKQLLIVSILPGKPIKKLIAIIAIINC